MDLNTIKENTIVRDNFGVLYKQPKLFKATMGPTHRYVRFYLYLIFNDIILFYKKDMVTSYNYNILIYFHVYKMKNDILKL